MRVVSQLREQPRRVQAVVFFAVKTQILILMISLFVVPMLRSQQTCVFL